MLEALDKSWHPEHFACKECKKRIVENKFHESDGLPVCSKCFESKFQAICAACRKMVTEVSWVGGGWIKCPTEKQHRCLGIATTTAHKTRCFRVGCWVAKKTNIAFDAIHKIQWVNRVAG